VFGIVARLVTGLGVLFLHGLLVGLNGHSHNWYLATYTLVALVFAAHRAPSLDGWLRRRWSWWRFEPDVALFRSGFARQLVLVCAVYVLFASFVAKMIVSGLAWADGSTIGWMIDHQQSRWQWPVDWMNARPWVFAVLAIATLLLEAGVVLALFSDRARLPIFAIAAGFHVGIYLVMLPNFFSHIVCYALVINWGAVWRRGRPATGTAPATVMPSSSRPAPWPLAWTAALVLVSGGVVAAEYEAWPVSNVPVYEYHVGPQLPALHAGRLDDIEQLRAVVRDCPRGSHCLWDRRWLSLVFAGPAVDDAPVGWIYRSYRSAVREDWTTGRAEVTPSLGDAPQARKRRRLAIRAAVLDSPPGSVDEERVRSALRPLLPWLRRIAPSGYTQVKLVAQLEDPGPLTLFKQPLDSP